MAHGALLTRAQVLYESTADYARSGAGIVEDDMWVGSISPGNERPAEAWHGTERPVHRRPKPSERGQRGQV